MVGWQRLKCWRVSVSLTHIKISRHSVLMSCMCTRVRGGTALGFVLEKCKNWINLRYLERIEKSWSWNDPEYIRYWGILKMWRYWIGRKDSYNGQEACAYRFWKFISILCIDAWWLLFMETFKTWFWLLLFFSNEIENRAIV